MRNFIWWLRSCLCNHKWNLEESEYTHTYYNSYYEEAKEDITRVSATCEKCGWHQSYNKYF